MLRSDDYFAVAVLNWDMCGCDGMVVVVKVLYSIDIHQYVRGLFPAAHSSIIKLVGGLLQHSARLNLSFFARRQPGILIFI